MTDQTSHDLEYSPSSLVEDIGLYLSKYRGDSAACRAALGQTVQLDLAYGPDPRHRLDFFPAADLGAPLIVFVHGGFWCELDQTSFSFPAQAFTSAGVNYAALTYRLAPQARLTEIVADVRAALDWLAAQAGSLRFDRRRMVLAGHSAGAHLCAMAMAQPPSLAGEAFAGAILVSGVYDLEPVRRSYVNDTVGMDRDEALANSPLLQAPQLVCPAHLIVGEIETTAFKAQSRWLYDAWQPHLPAVELVERAGRNHFDILFDFADPTTALFRKALQYCAPHAATSA